MRGWQYFSRPWLAVYDDAQGDRRPREVLFLGFGSRGWGAIQKLNSGPGFRELTIPPKPTIVRQDDQERAIDLLNRAKQLCLVAAVEQKFERSRAVEGQHLIVA
jgi:hypothetical protein